MTTLKYRRIGLGEFAGSEYVQEFTDAQAAIYPGCIGADDLSEKSAQSILDTWNRNLPKSWRYELVTGPVARVRAPRGDTTLDQLSLGERTGGLQEIDAKNHGGIAQVVVKLEGYQNDYQPGLDLASRIVALPTLIKALRDIGGRADMSVYDMATAARAALEAAGIQS